MTQSILQKHFVCVEEWWPYRDWGFMVVPLEVRPVLGVDFDAFVFTLKTMLPGDAKLVMMDGHGIRTSVSGEYYMIFASKEWARIPDGAQMPRLNPVPLHAARHPRRSRRLWLWDHLIPKRIREYIKGIRCARSAGHGWRYSFYCARAFRFLSTWR